MRIEGRVTADGNRGCASGNDSAGGGAGGSILLIGDSVTITSSARISAHGGRGGDSQPKCLPCTRNSDCGTGQSCSTRTDPKSGTTYQLCTPCNCTPCSSNADCTYPGQTCKDLGGSLGNVCADSSNQCTPYDVGDNEGECAATQNSGTCDDCAGGGGGGIINVQSRVASIDPLAIFDVRGAPGGICPICAGEAGGGAGELQLDSAYVGEICDGFDNDFDGQVDEGLGTIDCPDGTTIEACVGGEPQDCSYDGNTCTTATTDTRPRFAMIVDTSGSMLNDLDGNPTFGDGSIEHPGVDTASDADAIAGNNSRLFIAKRALTNVLSAFPENDFALARYYQDVGVNRSCQTASSFECAMSCCSYDDPTNNGAPAYPGYYPGNTCVLSDLYPGAGYGFSGAAQNMSIGWATANADCINYAGSCGPPDRGAQFITGFGHDLSDYLMWLDGAETNFLATTAPGDHCAGGDCELRGTGPTPLAGALAATQSYLTPIATCDGAKACRTYATILLTDGAESCQGDPVTAASNLLDAPTGGKPIKTYVIGFSVLPEEQQQLDDIAVAGGTDAAYFAEDEDDLANAIATIVSDSQVFETCNGLDDDCDQLVDEGFNVFEVCAPNTACGSGQCDMGRCPCLSDDDCADGYACDNGGATGTPGFCRPECQRGVSTCTTYGVKKCGGACCVNDGQEACVPLEPGTPGEEVCNGLDDDCDGDVDEGLSCSGCVPQDEVCNNRDDDCDGIADNNLTDVGVACGIEVGVCTAGTTSCENGVLVCDGGQGPSQEVCDGFDNDCNGVVDGMSEACYDGPDGTKGVGLCREGTRQCIAEPESGAAAWSACQGEVQPASEECDGLDNDCDGVVDNVPGIGQYCCTSGKCDNQPSICQSGTLQCTSSGVVCVGEVLPGPEVCNGIDDDCDGTVDNLGGGVVGESCCPSGRCDVPPCHSGTWVCDQDGLVCQGAVNPIPELCNDVDDDCNGVVDDVPGIGTSCCTSGRCSTEPDAQCKPGVLQCSSDGGFVCVGETLPTDEVCNGLDDDCNGVIDDVPGLNEPCCPDGSAAPGGCNRGECLPGHMVCQGDELVCDGGRSASPEVCDGLDNDCNGVIDDDDSVAESDPRIGAPCDIPEPPNDQPPCSPGTGVCQGGSIVCTGANHGSDEICNGIDDDCDGITDDGELCEDPKACINGVCRSPCSRGEFACPGNQDCENGYCVPKTTGTGGAAGAAGSAGQTSAGNAGEAGSIAEAGETGNAGEAGSTNQAGASGQADTGTGNAGVGATSSGEPEAEHAWGLAKGGGACGCRVAQPRRNASAVLLLLVGGSLLRRRRYSNRHGKGGAR